MQRICSKIFFSLLWIFVLARAQHLHEQQQQQPSQKLKVSILYESLCPDSIRFMLEQLGTSYDALKPYIDVQLVPFGKSYSENNGAKFYCQHGPAECDGNRMQSCVLNQTHDQDAQVKFAVCQMTTEDRSSIKYCAESAGLSGDIEECMNSQLGTILQLQAEQITQKYNPKFVPTIVYNDVFNQVLQNRSLKSFFGTVCGALLERQMISASDPNSPCN